ncbi:MAG: hypothetical protein HC792_04055, partial [Acaryochloridaceae cyanobacterium CSU_5_19]|nr:hypothetical protein [Acaryochloridaceae cyanobacterium CSU_5_19]
MVDKGKIMAHTDKLFDLMSNFSEPSEDFQEDFQLDDLDALGLGDADSSPSPSSELEAELLNLMATESSPAQAPPVQPDPTPLSSSPLPSMSNASPISPQPLKPYQTLEDLRRTAQNRQEEESRQSTIDHSPVDHNMIEDQAHIQADASEAISHQPSHPPQTSTRLDQQAHLQQWMADFPEAFAHNPLPSSTPGDAPSETVTQQPQTTEPESITASSLDHSEPLVNASSAPQEPTTPLESEGMTYASGQTHISNAENNKPAPVARESNLL